MNKIFFQQSWKNFEDVKIPVSNRSFRYGDGLFETFRFTQQHWPFEKYHWERLQEGAAKLKIDLPQSLQEQVRTALQALPKSESFSCRLTTWRSGAGKYTPQSLQAEWLLEAQSFANNQFETVSDGLLVDLGKTLISPSSYSNFKTANALEYVMASIEKEERELDDLLLSNCYGELAEACHSNLFFVIGDLVITPTLISGCLKGVIRKVLLSIENGPQAIIEQTVYPSIIEQASEIWLTDSLHGIRWVNQCGNLKFGNHWANVFQDRLNQLAQE